MAGSINKVTILGRLGKDPEVRSLPSGGKVCNLSVATSETWRDKESAERKERTTWHNVVIFNEGLVGIAQNYLRKGSRVHLEGQLETRKWQDQSGADRYTTEIVLRQYRGELTLIDKADAEPEATPEPRPAAAVGPRRASTDDLDDEIPF